MAEDVTIRSATRWEEVRRAAIGAGRTFSGRTPEEPFFFERTVSAPTLPLDNTLLVRVDGTTASQLQVYERQNVLGDARVWVGAIENVYTLPEYQGEGYATRLLEYARDFLDEKGYAYSILLTGERLEPLYRRCGWERLPQTNHRVSDPAPIDSGTTSDLEPFAATDDLDALAGIYRETRGSIDGSVVRTRPYWKHWILEPAMEVIEAENVVFYRPDEGVQGYMIWERRDDSVACLEAGYAGQQSETFLSECWDFLVSMGTDSIVWYPSSAGRLSEMIDADVRSESIRGRMIQVHYGDIPSRLAATAIRSTGDFADYLAADDFSWSPVDSF